MNTVMVEGPCADHDYSGPDVCTDETNVLMTMSGSYERCSRACADSEECTHMTTMVMSKEMVWCTLLSGDYSPGNDWSYMSSEKPMGEETYCHSMADMHMYQAECDMAGCS